MLISQTFAALVLSFTLSTAMPTDDSILVTRANRGVHIKQVTSTDYGTVLGTDTDHWDRPPNGDVKVKLVDENGHPVNPDLVKEDKWYSTEPSLDIHTVSVEGASNYSLTIAPDGKAGGDLLLTLNIPVGGPAVFTSVNFKDKCKIGDSASNHGAPGSNRYHSRDMDCRLE